MAPATAAAASASLFCGAALGTKMATPARGDSLCALDALLHYTNDGRLEIDNNAGRTRPARGCTRPEELLVGRMISIGRALCVASWTDYLNTLATSAIFMQQRNAHMHSCCMKIALVARVFR